jgi:nitric oxide reductase NorQ protein
MPTGNGIMPANPPPARTNVKGPRAMTTPPTTPPGTAAPGPVTTARAAGRLRNGELRRQVAGFLADRAGREFTPGEVARGLPGGPRSSGAVGNALAVLADRGEADQASTKPVRYGRPRPPPPLHRCRPPRPARPAGHAHPARRRPPPPRQPPLRRPCRPGRLPRQWRRVR